MTRGLKITMIVWGALGILLGLGLVFAPQQLGTMQGYTTGPSYVPHFLALLGVNFIIISIFIILAGRDPLKNVMWVQMTLAWAVLAIVVEATSVARGLVTIDQVMMSLVIDAVFAVALLVFYPWRMARIQR